MHLKKSTLIDVQTQVLAPNGNYILTADRDEKIRVSQYPKTYNIETFCLGHTEYASSHCYCLLSFHWQSFSFEDLSPV
jgi:WD40 repeat protein